MSDPRRFSTIVVVLLAAALTGACSGQVQQTSPQGPDRETVVLETCGVTQEFSAPNVRVAVTEGGVLDAIAALDVPETVVSRSGLAFAPDPAIASRFVNVPDLAPSAPSTEGLLGAQPDLIIQGFAWHLDAAQGGADADTLRSAGAQIYPTRTACATGERQAPDDTLEGALLDIDNIGALLGVSDRADTLTGRLRAERDAVVARVADRPRVPGVQLFVTGDQLFASASGLSGDVVEVAGMENLLADQDRLFVPASAEVIAALNPQAISLLTFPGQTAAEQVDFIRRTAPTTDAVRNGRIAVTEASSIAASSPRSFEALTEIAEFLHPTSP